MYKFVQVLSNTWYGMVKSIKLFVTSDIQEGLKMSNWRTCPNLAQPASKILGDELTPRFKTRKQINCICVRLITWVIFWIYNLGLETNCINTFCVELRFGLNTGFENVKTMFQFIKYLLFVNHGQVLISGVNSPVISYLWSTAAIRGLPIAWDMCFNHIFYRYLKHDELPTYDGPTPWKWRTNPAVG